MTISFIPGKYLNVNIELKKLIHTHTGYDCHIEKTKLPENKFSYSCYKIKNLFLYNYTNYNKNH